MRKSDWPTKLEHYLEASKNTSFKYGVFDCALFSAGAIFAITGTDIGEPYRGKYTDEASGVALTKAVTGGLTLEDIMDHAATQNEFIKALPSVLHAQRGDVVSLQLSDTISLGVVGLNGKAALFLSDKGLIKIKVSSCKSGWRIS